MINTKEIEVILEDLENLHFGCGCVHEHKNLVFNEGSSDTEVRVPFVDVVRLHCENSPINASVAPMPSCPLSNRINQADCFHRDNLFNVRTDCIAKAVMILLRNHRPIGGVIRDERQFNEQYEQWFGECAGALDGSYGRNCKTLISAVLDGDPDRNVRYYSNLVRTYDKRIGERSAEIKSFVEELKRGLRQLLDEESTRKKESSSCT